jgi:tRNA dimethylallyltransferase
MDIGTAKPTPAERAAVPHHLIDLLPPTQAYSAAQFVADARRLVGAIQARGRMPLLVGGTMLYFKALADGLDAMPAADPAVRAALDARAAAEGWPALHAELARVDPATAARLPPTDAQRIQRALEVWQLSGRPLSALHGAARTPGLSLPLLALEPGDRAWLHRRIAERFDAMLDGGLVDEVRALRARGDLRRTCRRCAAWATARPGPRWMPRATACSPAAPAGRRCARPASPPPASWPSAS